MSINDHLAAVLALPGCGGGLVREPDMLVIAESAEVEPAMIEPCQPRHGIGGVWRVLYAAPAISSFHVRHLDHQARNFLIQGELEFIAIIRRVTAAMAIRA